GVDDQVQDHLLQLDSISLNERQAVRQLSLHRNTVLRRFASGQRNNLEDRIIYCYAILACRCLLDQRSYPVDDLDGSIAVLADTTEGLPDLLGIWRLGAQPS